MDENKDKKLAEEIRKLSAIFIEREADRSSLITVTGTEIYNRGKNAKILITVIPESKEEIAVSFLKRQKDEMRKYIMKNIRVHHIPFLDIQIDYGEKNRQLVENLLNQ